MSNTSNGTPSFEPRSADLLVTVILSQGSAPYDLESFNDLFGLVCPDGYEFHVDPKLVDQDDENRVVRLSLAGQLLLESALSLQWVSATVEIERQRLIGLLEHAMEWEPLTASGLYERFCTEPQQDVVMVAALFWLIADGIVALAYDDQLILCQVDPEALYFLVDA